MSAQDMSHPPQEEGNRSLVSCSLLAVLWQMCHVWITYWIVSGSLKVITELSNTRGKSTILRAFGCLLKVLSQLEDLWDVL